MIRLESSVECDFNQTDALYDISCGRCVVCFVVDGWFSRCGFRGYGLVCVHTKGWGLTFTSARVLVRAPIDGASYPPTDTKDHTDGDNPTTANSLMNLSRRTCAVCALMPPKPVSPPHVCHGRGTKLSPEART